MYKLHQSVGEHYFFAIGVSPTVREVVTTVAHEWSQHLPPNTNVRWVDPDLYHITLQFIGELTLETQPELFVHKEKEPEEVLKKITAEVAQQLKTFTMCLDAAGAFPRATAARVLYLSVMEADGVEEGSCHRAHLALAAILAKYKVAVDPHVAKFRPHITLGRSHEPVNISLDWFKREPLAWQINELLLVASTLSAGGPNYRVVAHHPLTSCATIF